MTITLSQVVDLAELALRPVTRSADLDRPLRWVAVSEQVDPTPWIEAGDLVLTTGLTLSGAREECRAYVDRLHRADAAGIGFGIGLHHAQVPKELIVAAESAGLPVVEVGEPVPFVAVSRAVSRLLAAEEYADAGASFTSQRRMIRSLLSVPAGEESGSRVRALLAVVSRHVRGFALHLAPSGDVLGAHPPDAAARAGELLGEIDRLRPRGLLASGSLARADEHVSLVPVGEHDTVRGFLVVGSPRPLSPGDQAVMNLAVSLLSWEVGDASHRGGPMGAWHALLIAHAQSGALTSEVLASIDLGDLAAGSAVAVAVMPGTAGPVTVPAIPGAVLGPDGDGGVVGFVPVDDDGSPTSAARAVLEGGGGRSVGVSEPIRITSPHQVRTALVQARTAARTGRGWTRHGDVPGRSMDSLIDGDVAVAWANACLGALLSTSDGTDMVATLRAWLSHHGQVDATAQELGIHRHTVRHRLRRIEAVLGRSLEDTTVRADLWFAIRVRDAHGGWESAGADCDQPAG